VEGDRYVVLGLANVRSPWFREVGRWATAAVLPVDFVRCVSAEELRARLAGGRTYSAALIDGGLHELDRDLIDMASASGAAIVIIDDGRTHRDWSGLGATAVLTSGFRRDELMDVLERHGRAIDRSILGDPSSPESRPDADWMGRLVTVTGGSGSGVSTLSMALGQGIGADLRFTDLTLVADFALRADLAMLHDARDIVPGIQELVEAHRTGTPSISEVRSLVFDASGRGYHLLLGLRRHRDWSVLRPRAISSAIDSLLSSYRVVVADVEPDLEGEDEVGSIDVEERNALARTTVVRADLVVAVGTPSLKGLYGLIRVLGDLLAFGVQPERIVPVLNRSGRSRRQRAEATAAFGELVAPLSELLATPIHIPYRRQLEETARDGAPIPAVLTQPLASAVLGLLDKAGHTHPAVGEELVPVAPGSVGHFFDGNHLE
jgi:hypothetical protein